jgi:hypothetical protein
MDVLLNRTVKDKKKAREAKHELEKLKDENLDL